MRSTVRQVMVVAGLLAAVVAVGAVPAAASQPISQSFSGSFTEQDTATCGFPIVIHQDFTASVLFFLDAAGNLDHSLNHLQLRGTYSANGVSLVATADFTHTFDFTTGVNGDLGLEELLRSPGGGVIEVDAGRVLTDESGNVLFFAGNHLADASRFCAAFS
jgi:hypothetical protein